MMTLYDFLRDCWCETEVVIVDEQSFDPSVDPREQSLLVTNSFKFHFDEQWMKYGDRMVKSFGVIDNALVVEVE